jgi:hypothetical protein
LTLDGTRFDALSQSLARALSRRTLGGLSVGVAFSSLLPAASAAKTDPHRLQKGKKGKKASKKLPRNQFGCVNVGQHCRGKNSNCCSGVCKGKKPQPGQKDTTVCAAHNDNSCTPARDLCVVGPSNFATALCNPNVSQALCFTTTGNGGFCGNTGGFTPETNCKACAKDKDCEVFGFPAGSACVLVTGFCATFCPATGNRACVPPGS